MGFFEKEAAPERIVQELPKERKARLAVSLFCEAGFAESKAMQDILHCVVLYCIVLYCIVLCCIALYCIVL